MSDAVIFVAVFGAFFVLRIIAATVVFLWILPQGDRCPHCDTPTLRIQSKGWNTLMPWFRTSWCLDCGWEGLLRAERVARQGAPAAIGAAARRRAAPERHRGA